MFYSIFILAIGVFVQSGLPGDSTLTLKSPAFRNGHSIPVQYTCDGNNVSPEVQWSGVPGGTKSFVLIIDDPDAGSVPWVHWVIFNIPAKQRMLQTNIPNKKKLKIGALQGINDFKHMGFGGPCPPKGPPHQYVMKLYALSTKLDLKAGATKKQVVRAMKGQIIEKTELKAPYKRK